MTPNCGTIRAGDTAMAHILAAGPDITLPRIVTITEPTAESGGWTARSIHRRTLLPSLRSRDRRSRISHHWRSHRAVMVSTLAVTKSSGSRRLALRRRAGRTPGGSSGRARRTAPRRRLGGGPSARRARLRREALAAQDPPKIFFILHSQICAAPLLSTPNASTSAENGGDHASVLGSLSAQQLFV